jgi:hypothetical protein
MSVDLPDNPPAPKIPWVRVLPITSPAGGGQKLAESNTLLQVGTGLVTVYVALQMRHRACRIGQKVQNKLYGPLEGFFRKRVPWASDILRHKPTELT